MTAGNLEKKEKYINIIKKWIEFKSKNYKELDEAVNEFMDAYLYDKEDRNDFDRIEIYQVFQFGYALGRIKTFKENDKNEP
jgi:hypothetical protein